jgi:hypothetical protein
MPAKASSSGRSSAFDVFLADALLSRILAGVGGPFNFGGVNLTDHQRRAVASGLIRNAALVKFQTSTRQIVVTFDLPADDEPDPVPAAADVAPEVLAEIIEAAKGEARVLPPDHESPVPPDLAYEDNVLPEQQGEELSFNRSAGARPTPDEIRGGGTLPAKPAGGGG